MVKKCYFKNFYNLIILFGIVVFVFLILDFWSEVIVILLIIGGGYCVYYVYDKKCFKCFILN